MLPKVKDSRMLNVKVIYFISTSAIDLALLVIWIQVFLHFFFDVGAHLPARRLKKDEMATLIIGQNSVF